MVRFLTEFLMKLTSGKAAEPIALRVVVKDDKPWMNRKGRGQ